MGQREREIDDWLMEHKTERVREGMKVYGLCDRRCGGWNERGEHHSLSQVCGRDFRSQALAHLARCLVVQARHRLWHHVQVCPRYKYIHRYRCISFNLLTTAARAAIAMYHLTGYCDRHLEHADMGLGHDPALDGS